MGFFSKILEKLGFDAGSNKVEETMNTPATPASPAAPEAVPVTPMREIDVVAQLEQKAAANPKINGVRLDINAFISSLTPFIVTRAARLVRIPTNLLPKRCRFGLRGSSG
ncbi:hypothetical protein [Lacisediminimonas profundi]|uniref:hypothetical protein n=1 Tax=Lacisediminimonas profundi TaxID=2603856 RepID=UPI00124B6957|nr:hypothetical protein [Lacisediminimonas profundi]